MPDAGGQIYGWNERAEERAEALLSASGLFETVVRDVNGKRLGEIEDFILDFAAGKVEYVVFSFGGLFGLGNKLCAVAPNLLELDDQNKCFRLSYDRKRVGNAPEFDKYEWRHSPWTAHRGQIYILRNRKRRREAGKIRSDHLNTSSGANAAGPKIASGRPG
ncbi:MAG: PRC-barrel domain-containing protein [Gammaproteobacteria bacterium]